MVKEQPISLFHTYEEFWAWCNSKCPDRAVGCARKCLLRKMLDIPPFGRSYEGKLQGRIEVGVAEGSTFQHR
jgi:hypothetical protein